MAEVPTLLEELRAKASLDPKHIVLSEGDDPRVVAAAIAARNEKIAFPALVGNEHQIQTILAQMGDDGAGITIYDPASSALRGELSAKLLELRAHKGMTAERADKEIMNRLIFAAALVQTGHEDGTVGGAVETTSDTVRAALQVIGKHKNAAIVSSFFLMAFPKWHHSGVDAMIFSDCGLVIEPNSEELAAIAEAAASSCKTLLGKEPKIALLSFSTKGSARHARVDKVQAAVEMLQIRRADLDVDGELQFDAAIIPSVGEKKAPSSLVAGQANVLIFPDLDVGNIGYKIAQRLGGAHAIGPVLQGLALPANDLSRGAVVDDIVNIIAVTAVQAQYNSNKN